MLKKKSVALALVMLVLASMAACGKDKNSTKANEPGSDNEIVLSDENKADADDDDDYEELQKPAEEKRIQVNAAVVGDCTGMGFAPIMGWGEKDKNHEKYSLTVKQNADEVIQMLSDGSADVAIVPLDSAVNLYKDNKSIEVLATNTFNNIYVADATGTATDKAALSGKTIAVAENGTLTSNVAKQIAQNCGATVQPYASNEEIQAGLIDGSIQLAIVPEPYITLAKMSNDVIEMGPDVAELWAEINNTDIISSVFVARRDFVDKNEDSMVYILDDLYQSVNTVIHGVTKTLDWTVAFNIVADRNLAYSTMENCNYNFIKDDEMRFAVEAYLLANSALFNNELPDEEFYYED